MKKVLSILAVMAVLFMASCVNEPSHPIVGHAYSPGDDDQMYFNINGKVRYSFFDSNMEYYDVYHYTYEIHDNVVSVYYDKSNFWKDRAKGKLFTVFTYSADGDVLYDENGHPWHRVEPRK